VKDDEELKIELLKIGAHADEEQRARLATLRATRDNALVATRLEALRTAARGTDNTIPFILDCARAYCTLYEIRAALESEFGAYREPVFF
jgi:methylmalonyl-CoA mutase N-terminal domain/subunit